MEHVDQVTQDQAGPQRPWHSFTEVEKGALLVNLASTLRQRILALEIDQPLAKAYRAYSQAALRLGQELVHKERVPFVPDPPYSWQQAPMDELNRRLPEINTWASGMVHDANQPVQLLHAALDLRNHGRQLEHQLDRTRSR